MLFDQRNAWRSTPHQIWRTERDQARRIRAGETLRQQTAIEE
ncbi:MAG: hypothetical protein ACRDR6_11010 [Pseudonocardiaceae bacterium]